MRELFANIGEYDADCLIMNEGTCGIDIDECANRPLVQTATVTKKTQDMAAT